MEKKIFTIEKVGWHTDKRRGILRPVGEVHTRFRSLAEFLQKNGLTTRQLIAPGEVLTDDFAISSSDMTEEGMKFIRLGYPKWLAAIDRGKDPSDDMILEKYFKKLRSSDSS